MTDLFEDNYHSINPILHNLQPMIESFFIIVKILHADEDMVYDPKTNRLMRKSTDTKKGISKLESKEGDLAKENPLLTTSFD